MNFNSRKTGICIFLYILGKFSNDEFPIAKDFIVQNFTDISIRVNCKNIYRHFCEIP